MEIKQNSDGKNNKTIQYRFNLTDIRHAKDKIQVYIYNPNQIAFEITSFEIKATTAIRN